VIQAVEEVQALVIEVYQLCGEEKCVAVYHFLQKIDIGRQAEGGFAYRTFAS
jgi:hypothetical protein